MLKKHLTPLEVISLYPHHGYTLPSLFETRARANPGRPFGLRCSVYAGNGEDEIMAVIVPKPGAKLTARDVGRWCAQRLAAHKVPRFVVFVDELPHTPTHKVAKFLLKQDPTLRAGAVDLTSSP